MNTEQVVAIKSKYYIHKKQNRFKYCNFTQRLNIKKYYDKST